MVHAPGFQSIVRAYHDGDRFFVDVARLFELLGYAVTRRQQHLTAADAQHTFMLDFVRMEASSPEGEPASFAGSMLYDDGRYLVAAEWLGQLFGADVHFDEARLSLQLSSAAERFNTFALGPRSFLYSEAPGPLRFGRERRLLGGLIASWHATQGWDRGRSVYTDASVHFASSILGGSLRGFVGSTSEITYLYDRPGSMLLKQLELGRMAGGHRHALRLSNLPLVSPYLQRTAALEGRAEPHAMVEVLAGGQVVDRAQAGQDGRYRLRMPVFYGSTEAVVRVQPLGGAQSYEERRYILTTSSLAPPGQLHYDAVLGQRSTVQARYGVLPQLTARASAQYHGSLGVGVTANPWPFVVLSADMAWPGHRVQAHARLWRRNLSAAATFAAGHSHLVISGQWQRLSVQVTGSAARDLHLVPSVSYHGYRGIVARVQIQPVRNGLAGWQTTAAGTWPAWGGAVQLGLFARGAHVVQTSGLEALLNTRNWALGVMASYDPVLRQVSGQITVQVRTHAFGIASRANSSGSHRHSAYGSISIGPGIRASRALRGETAAILRIFEDLDGNGRPDAGEPLLPDVEAQIFHASLHRADNGVLHALYLEPYATYQVQLIEQSISDPWLRPATGYAFSFIADPGRTKLVDIPLQRIPLIRGRVQSVDRPAARLRIRAFLGDTPVGRADVFRDGGFALRLRHGSYVLVLEDAADDTVLLTRPLLVPAGMRVVDVELIQD